MRNEANNAPKKEKRTDAKRSDQNSSVDFCDGKAEKSSDVNSAPGGKRTLKRLATLICMRDESECCRVLWEGGATERRADVAACCL